MQPTITTANDGTLLFQMKVTDLLSDKQLKEVQADAIREYTNAHLAATFKDLLKEAVCIKVKTAAQLLDTASVETIRGYGKLATKHPKYLPIIPGESAWGDKIRIVDLIAWCDRNSKPGAKDRISQYESKIITK